MHRYGRADRLAFMKKFALILSFLVWGMSGLSALAQADHKLSIVDEKLDRIQAEVEALQFQQKKMQEQIAALQQQVRGMQQQAGGDGGSAAELRALDERISALDAQRERDRKLILDTLSKEIVALTSGGAVGESGVVHKVAKGETLSGIARGYGVTQAALVKINNISDPNAIQIGQELVIPK